MFYDKKIKYFDYMKSGERLRGAGFVKMEVRNGICKLQLQVSGLQATDTFVKRIYLVGKTQEMLSENIELKAGKGTLQLSLAAEDLCNGLAYRELKAIRIPISSGRELYCRVCEEPVTDTASDVTETGKPEPEKVQIEAEMPELPEAKSGMPETEAGILELPATETEMPELTEAEADMLKPKEVEPEMAEPAQAEPEKIVLADKWSQLSAIYPHICPFQDEREYLKIGPEDFVILNQKSYHLAHNSFLLHGYYNYRHLILYRLERRGEAHYYIGVPGNFYEREKQVAMMFGFESFECESEPAGTGDYGYYMIPVNL